MKSAERALGVLRAVARSQPTSMPELHRELDIPRSSLHGLMAVLVEQGFIHLDDAGRLSVGLGAFEVGSAWLETTSLESAAAPVLTALVDDVDQIAHIAVLEGTEIVYVMKQENASPVRLVSAVGKRLPAHTTAVGKALLGSLAPDELASRYQGVELVRLTDSTVTSLPELTEQLARAAASGVWLDRGESTPGVNCYAAPIRDRRDEDIAAVSISVIDRAGDPRRPEHYAQSVVRAASEISTRLGGSSTSPR